MGNSKDIGRELFDGIGMMTLNRSREPVFIRDLDCSVWNDLNELFFPEIQIGFKTVLPHCGIRP